jgi:phosphodiesterase/alkaline phosphatase D-like protein
MCVSNVPLSWDNPWPFIRNTSSPLASEIHAFSDEDEAMAATFASYWTSLGASGDPNSDGAVVWPSVAPGAALGDMPHMQMQMPPSASQGLESESCDFWDQFLGY